MRLKKILSVCLLIMLIGLLLTSCHVYYKGVYEYQYEEELNTGYRLELYTDFTFKYYANDYVYFGIYKCGFNKAELVFTKGNLLDGEEIGTLYILFKSRDKIKTFGIDGTPIELKRVYPKIGL